MIDHDGAINWYSSSQIRPFVEKPSVLGDSIADRGIEDFHTESASKEDEPAYDEKNIQLNVDYESYGEHSVTNESDSIQKERDEEIAKARKILKQTDEIMNSNQSNQREYEAKSKNSPLRRVARQHSHTSWGMATRTRS